MHHSLPRILYKNNQKSTSSYSKAPRGLSVLLRVLSIFTEFAISPRSFLRQCPTRYAIRAGQNLPDKEFRYLRTVIVTAAVYWRFKSNLRSKPLSSPLNVPAPGRRQPLYVIFRFSRDLCFGKQLLGPIHCGRPWPAPLIPKLRGQFAEFLKMDYLAAFSILNSSTSVGLRYGFSISH